MGGASPLRGASQTLRTNDDGDKSTGRTSEQDTTHGTRNEVEVQAAAQEPGGLCAPRTTHSGRRPLPTQQR